MSAPARLVCIIAIAVLATPAIAFEVETQAHGLRGSAGAIWPYVVEYLDGGTFGAYGPTIYAPDQIYLQAYLYDGPTAAANPSADGMPVLR